MQYSVQTVLDNIKARVDETEGLTINSLTKKAGLGALTIYNWMNGRADPSLWAILRVMNVLEMTPDEVFLDGGG